MGRMRASEILHVEELMTVSFFGHQAMVIFSEDPIPVPGDDSVAPIAEPLWQQT
jgi:hypothetical protein